MNSLLFSVSVILATLHSVWRWLLPTWTSPLQGAVMTPRQRPRHDEFASPSRAKHRAYRRSKQPCSDQNPPRHHRPLRIVRVMEAGQAPAQVGRMVISGRMADVCAELDRLAAREAALY